MLFAESFNPSVNTNFQIKTKMDQVTVLSDQFNDLQNHLEILDDQGKDIQFPERREFNELFYNVKAALLYILRQRDIESTNSSNTNLNSSGSFEYMRLPVVTAATFDGNIQCQHLKIYLTSYSTITII